MGKQTLISLDTNHIKQYVFATDRLKDIRGASSRLDHLNRRAMHDVAQEEHLLVTPVYTNGGSGMFLVEGDRQEAERFGRLIQKEYTNRTKGGATVSFAVQELPNGVDPWKDDIQKILELLNFRLLTAKAQSQDLLALPSHPFMRPCDSCGSQYAEGPDVREDPDPDEQRKRYCEACRTKRLEDNRVRRGIEGIINERINTEHVKNAPKHSYIWGEIINKLPQEYHIPPKTERPSDFNELPNIGGGKDYLGLIYADGNNMGKIMGQLQNLTDRKNTAETIDTAIFTALSIAINTHLKVIKTPKPMFPFDVLMVGGDDIMIVTPAAVALDVAATIAEEFHKKTGYTLSVGVVLAPIKYPFGLLQDLAESTLKHAKKEGAKKQAASEQDQKSTSYINFLVVAGSTSHDFQQVYSSLHKKHVPISGKKGDAKFYATLRPYKVEEMKKLLNTIREGRRLSLGRTKLHQMREAVLKMNLTTSVSDGLAVLRNWHTGQRDFVLEQLFTLGKSEGQHNIDEPGSWFPRVTFPWFADGDDTYRTSLLDIVELYDFVATEGGSSGNED
ncbi:MAG TPA: hypothetical protein VFB60_12095 [Ktedonobacteraceae bacterium]|nr:hypothetical protein [Ktedonobacteraceae bacterium]